MTDPKNLLSNARNGQYIYVNALGQVYKVDSRYIGSYGATVYKMTDGKLVRQFGL